jgi:hypothetical protein
MFACLELRPIYAQNKTQKRIQDADEPARAAYQINLNLNFDERTFSGTERVRWTNTDDHSTRNLYFHLYPNMRSDAAASDAEEPHLEISAVRLIETPANRASAKPPLTFSFEDGARAVLRVNLREAVKAGESIELELVFKGDVPEIDADATSLPAHIMQQVGAALNNAREVRRARDINFKSRGIMLLGAAFPVLAVRDENGDWQRKIEASIGDFLYTDIADYSVTIKTENGVNLFTSADLETNAHHARSFAGKDLRHFTIVAGRNLQSAEREASGVRVRAVWQEGHEKIGRRALDIALDAVRVFTNRFGALPLKTVTIAEAPLVAGFGCTEFAGLGVVASAYFVDFDAPAMKLLPDIVREQRSSVEDSFEFTVARVVAHQWWGVTVGNDPARAPLLDEALAHWSALLYFQDARSSDRAAQILEDQLRGVYAVYRALGGEDMTAERASKDFRNSFQYAAIVSCKGALMFEALRAQLGDAKFFAALQRYYAENRFQNAVLDDLQNFFEAAAPAKRGDVARTFNHWLDEKHGDEDIAPPNAQLAALVGDASAEQKLDLSEPSASKDRNAFVRLGKFFWRQMIKIR